MSFIAQRLERRILKISIFVSLVFTGVTYAQDPTLGPEATFLHYSPLNPAPYGVALSDVVACGDSYDSHETYDVKITLIKVIRGNEAWKLIKEASASNRPPEEGFDYVLVQLRFAFFAKGVPGNCAFEVSEKSFTAISSKGKEYKIPSLILPGPALRSRLSSGDVVEGWVCFLVEKEDLRPVLTFNPTMGIWFRLY